MLTEETKPKSPSVLEEPLTLAMPLPDRVTLVDRSVSGEVLPEAMPAPESVAHYPMQAHQLGLPAALRHGVALDIPGVLAVTPDVCVPLGSLGLVAPDVNRAAMEAREAREARGNAPCVDLGAQVGIMLAMEYTAGSRSHRLSNGTFGYGRPFTIHR
ncbi:MAG: hypothetical protein IVW55_09485 [Chloroflexi bacterium]|nr:hypothetical protein [Chloroflexota bacterium]